MADELVRDELWKIVQPLLPESTSRLRGRGRPRSSDRAAFAGIVYVLKSGIPWRMLPSEFGCSGVTCWRRLREWKQAGVFKRLQQVLLDRLGKAGRIDWSRASLDSASIPAKKGAKKPALTR